MDSATKTPEQLLEELKQAAKAYALARGHGILDTGEPMFPNDGRVGVTAFGEQVRFAAGLAFGTLVIALSPFDAMDLGCALVQRAKEVILAREIQAEVNMTKPALN